MCDNKSNIYLCDNPYCNCDIQATSTFNTVPISPSREKFLTLDGINNLLEIQSSIVETINGMKLQSLDNPDSNQLFSKIVNLKYQVEMVMMILEYWLYQYNNHNSTSNILDNTSKPDKTIHDINDIDNNPDNSIHTNTSSNNNSNIQNDEYEAVFIDNITSTNSINLNPSISSEEQLEKILTTTSQDSDSENEIEYQTENHLEEISNNLDLNDIDLDDLELEDVNLEEADSNIYNEDNTLDNQSSTNIQSNTMDITNLKDLLSMMFMMSMSNDSESLINIHSQEELD
jgi:hypothetical protein